MCREVTNAMGLTADGIPGEIQISRTGGIRTTVDVGLYVSLVAAINLRL